MATITAMIELRRVPYGTTFAVFGDKFVALDYVDNGVLAIRRNIWKDAPFNRNGVNNFRTATINGTLADYEDTLTNAGAAGNVLVSDIDLRATDGTREYGHYIVGAGLLTLKQYGRYQHIIPDADRAWWLATPWRTPDEKCGSSYYVWRVNSNGNISHSGCTNTCGVRPALLFAPSLLVVLEDEVTEKTEEDKKQESYAAYCEYVRGWSAADCGEHDFGSSPRSFEDWKNWKP